MILANGYWAPLDKLPREILLFPAGARPREAVAERDASTLSVIARELDREGLLAVHAAAKPSVYVVAVPGGERVIVDRPAFDALAATFAALLRCNKAPRVNFGHDPASPTACELDAIRWEEGRGILGQVRQWGDHGELAFAMGGWGVSPEFEYSTTSERPVSFMFHGIIASLVMNPAFGSAVMLPRIQ